MEFDLGDDKPSNEGVRVTLGDGVRIRAVTTYSQWWKLLIARESTTMTSSMRSRVASMSFV